MLKTVKLKDTGLEVLVAKYLTGFDYTDQANDIFTDIFEQYVKNWQRVNNLAEDGIIGPQCWKKMAEEAPTVSTSKNRKNPAVLVLQKLLDLDMDCIYGPKTKAAVSAYQANSNLKADGVCGPKTWKSLLTGEAEHVSPDQPVTPTEAVKPPDFKQYDSRWGKKMYSNHGDTSQTMANSACGPTSMADIVAEWWDVNITPYDLAQKSLEWGTRTYSSGTSGSFFKKCANLYGASQYTPTASIKIAISCLENGGYVVVCFGAGTKGKSSYQKWTKGGHYCCIWKYDGKYFYINDPASAKSSRAKGTYDEVLDARKGFYCFYR